MKYPVGVEVLQPLQHLNQVRLDVGWREHQTGVFDNDLRKQMLLLVRTTVTVNLTQQTTRQKGA